MPKSNTRITFSTSTTFSTFGYTLIEILVGLTIIGIIFGVGFASFREFSRRQSLAGGVKTLVGDLRLAQEQAISENPKMSNVQAVFWTDIILE